MAATRIMYGSRPWSLNGMRGNYIRRAGKVDMPYGILNVHFSTEV
jgi:hypothetical protein